MKTRKENPELDTAVPFLATMNRNGNFGLVFGWGGNTPCIHDFCIPLDFLGIKDLKKNLKRPKKISKAIAKATTQFIGILSFVCLMWTVLT